MSFSIRKIIAGVAWSLAFKSASELAFFIGSAAYAGARFGRGHSLEDVSSATDKIWSLWKVAPFVVGVLGLALGLAELLPGTRSQRD